MMDQDLSPLIASDKLSLKESVARLNETPHLVQLIVDNDGVLIGIVTDGDIRRALVRGVGLNEPINKAMNHDPLVEQSVEAAAIKLEQMGDHLNCIPIVDAANRPIALYSDAPGISVLKRALILAGGMGKRLGDRTQNTPKPLLSVGGLPILSHIIQDLEKFGVTDISISAFHLSEQIVEFVAEQPFKATIEVLVEEEPLGTAGSLGLLSREIEGPILVMNGDIITRTNYSAMMLQHQTCGADLTIGAARHEYEIPFGVINHDEHGQVFGITEKPSDARFVSAGVYILSPNAYRMIAEPICIDMPALIERVLAAGYNVSMFPIHEYWLDLGRPQQFDQAENDQQNWASEATD
jgi:dTDP-glucose pyrophosphorylase